jgi:hypothetical protein
MAKGDRWPDNQNVEVRVMRDADIVLGVIREREPLWVKRMAARHHKTLVVCQECHEAIHRERPKRHGFKNEATREPR